MVRRLFIILSLFSILLVVALAQRWPAAWWLFVIIGPFILLGLFDMSQRRHTIRRIYPVIGNLRYLFEAIRPEIQQYFVESDTNGLPFSREFRSLVYQRAKGVRDTRPFGTVFEVYRPGYEWMNPSLAPHPAPAQEPRVSIGGADCSQPYAASHLNISAMSYGALGRNAILALNKGARLGGFAHNTGEGGISSWHLEHGGDLVWQIGTGYFGCRTPQGRFDAELFAERARLPQVKMIEIKLSQGAKPGHGGILPAAKVTEEIARIRLVPQGEDVISPPGHTAFDSPLGLLEFIARLRELSGGKPVGFKLCVGHRAEFFGICKAMLETGITPDFITVDGSEGGTGAAPIELTNSVGMPMRDGLLLVHNALRGIGLRDRVRLIAAGKVASAFHLARLLALGADSVNAARSMMFALGCIQSRQCNTNRCPTGVATQDPARYRQLDIDDKAERVARYHASTIRALLELTGSAGLCGPEAIRPHHIMRRIDGTDIRSYAELYPWVESGCLLQSGCVPAAWAADWRRADPREWGCRAG
ncbi:FMN-binding glutamate synthase family protein [Thiohalobacter sp. IOR34]|uniref:FMN-binding glutamate synthase family protein n=1 Tax=Thiohalobacter sp. IOR34 TaxID=3057176 RepID=UPI0025B14656|nr:FMN-binding glutamate synthase family protein [Thiohalobacter sp. IOR34]WJW76210.1 FMN-binding glutamate synthase family protein [Thiohalobacter sp. IOR34]